MSGIRRTTEGENRLFENGTGLSRECSSARVCFEAEARLTPGTRPDRSGAGGGHRGIAAAVTPALFNGGADPLIEPDIYGFGEDVTREVAYAMYLLAIRSVRKRSRATSLKVASQTARFNNTERVNARGINAV
jgi:hypothetical protein